MAVTNYYTVNSEIIGEHTAGQSRLDYLPDALGSVIETIDQTLTAKSTARFKPYGADLATTGTTPSFGFTGNTGSRRTGRPHTDQYNQARHLGTTDARWCSIDPKWPLEPAFEYCGSMPVTYIDPSGRQGWCPLDTPCMKHAHTPCPDVDCMKNQVWNYYGAYMNETAISNCWIQACQYPTWSRQVFWSCIETTVTSYDPVGRHGDFTDWLYVLANYRYGNCCGYNQRCSGNPNQGKDCIDRACSVHDGCASTWQKLILDSACNHALCEAAKKCLISGCYSDSSYRNVFQQDKCVQASNEIIGAYCNIEMYQRMTLS